MNAIKKVIYQKAVPFVGKVLSNKNKYVQMIYYHDVVSDGGNSFMQIDKELFFKQMLYIKEKGYTTLLFSDLNKDDLFRKKSVIIAFDDGWKSNYTEIFDFMKQNGIKYNVFLAAGKIGTDPEFLTPDEVKKMSLSGIVGFGAHTYNHVTLEDIDAIDPEKEFELTDKLLLEWTGEKCLDLCFPKGIYTKESLNEMLKNTEYTRFWTSDLQYSENIDGKIVFGRSAISNDEPFSVFKAKLKGYYNCFNLIKGRKGF